MRDGVIGALLGAPVSAAEQQDSYTQDHKEWKEEGGAKGVG